MKKLLLISLPVVLGIIIFSVFAFFLSNITSGTGALQVTSSPESNVYINGKLIGKTPLCKCEGSDMLQTGEYDLKLVPTSGNNLSAFEQSVMINKSVLTVVDRTFGVGAGSSGSVITLQKSNDNNASISITSIPVGITVKLDSNNSGQTPTVISNVTDSDHELVFSKAGYINKTVHVHAVKGYQLNLQVFLGINLSGAEAASSEAISTPSAKLTNTPTPSSSTVTILQTPTGFLRVRFGPSLSASEEAEVNPGDTFPFIDSQSGWYEIKLQNGKTGWISSDYAKKS